MLKGRDSESWPEKQEEPGCQGHRPRPEGELTSVQCCREGLKHPLALANKVIVEPGQSGFSGVTGAEIRPQWTGGDVDMRGRGGTAA